MPSRRRSKRCRTPNVPPPFTSFAPDGIRGAGALAVVLTYSLPRAGGGTADAHGSGPCVRKDVRVQIPPRPRAGLCYSSIFDRLRWRPPCLSGGTTPRNPPRGPLSCCGSGRWPASRRGGASTVGMLLPGRACLALLCVSSIYVYLRLFTELL